VQTTSAMPVSSMTPAAPKVLDPFAGAGSISMEASRLGCEAYAGDLNPIAYRILRASLEFPSKLIHQDSKSSGSSSDRTWSGLISELRHWATEIDRRAVASIRDMYPPEPQSGSLVDRYFWFLFVRCPSPTCGVQYPAQPSLRLCNRSVEKSSIFTWHDGKLIPAALDELHVQERRGFYTCPHCGSQIDSDSVDHGDTSWRLCLVREESGRAFIPVSADAHRNLLLGPMATKVDSGFSRSTPN
jgi:putative DNA methylase